ncbi:MAG: sulfur carrier protein ThiS [Methyloceanibacter sp.]|uniref:sulfur carrier protein ThiS n=1 Tax=Methyloceanibacter sp. TaxID=1965321 RepID=UPI003D6D068A
MLILLNGERFATDASNLDELCAKLGFAEAKVATAVNGSFVAAAMRRITQLSEADEIEVVAPRQGG